MQKIFSIYIVFFLIISIVGCSDMPIQSSSSQTTNNYSSHTKSSRAHIADNDNVDGFENDYTFQTEEEPKKHNIVNKRGVYLLDSRDILDIETFEEEDLTITLRVADNGTIVYPLIGSVEVKGLSAQEAEEKLEKLLRDGGYLKNPQITIRLNLEEMKRYGDKEIYVMGEVRKPSAIPILGKNITVLEAIAKAQGFTDFAAPNRTTVTRIEDGVEKIIIVDLKKAKKGDRSLDIILKPGDLVVVPETFF